MDDLIEQLTTVDVTECVNSPNAPYSFTKFYKSNNLKNTQEKRRKELLIKQKRKREEAIDTARAIPSNICHVNPRKVHYHKEYQDRIMFSEWLVDIPEDFTDKWVFLPCPNGQRTLIVANKGLTVAYSKNGVLKTKFLSQLPGGSQNMQNGGETILDCIWNFTSKQHYVLDVIKWAGIDLSDCETEFRFFWLKSKFDECPQLNSNKSSFQLLQNYECSYERLTELMSKPYQFHKDVVNNLKQPLVDGILFYHRECSYEPGFTPLVTWLKPYMLPDILSVSVHEEYLKERPPSYTSLEKHIEESKKQKHNWWTVKSIKSKENINNSMEH